MKPQSIPKQARKYRGVVLLVSGASATIHISFILHSCPFMFLSCSFHVPFMLHSCLFMFLSFACIFLSFCIHFLSFRFQGYGNGFMAWPEDRVQQMVIAKLSLNNPTTYYDTVRRNFPQNDRGRERERGKKREREREREKESERVGCQMTWYSNCRKQGTTGWISLIGFARWVFAWFTPSLMDCRVRSQLIFFLGGGLSLYSVSCTSLNKKLLQY